VNSETVLEERCPHCRGKITSWYVFDDYGPAGGLNCENEGKYHCSDTLAWQTWREKEKS
jgi:hypothetical protein